MTRFLLTSLIYLVPLTAHAASRPVVLELFTSESCSSCPPADALLAELARSGAAVLPLGFHVDYWNQLRWHDRFSFAGATDRQRAYAASLGAGVYTPQLVVDGHFQAVGSDREAVQAAIAQARAAQATGPRIEVAAAGGEVAAAGGEVAAAGGKVAASGGRLTVKIGAGDGAAAVLLIGFDGLHRTEVGSGENAGRTVTEVNVVRSLVRLGDWHGDAASFTVAIPAGEQMAVLLQSGDGRILGASVP